jgi:hypothetical protein
MREAKRIPNTSIRVFASFDRVQINTYLCTCDGFLSYLRAVSTRVFWSRFRARDSADLQMDALLCLIDAKLHRTIDLAHPGA